MFLQHQSSDFENFVKDNPDLRITPAQARYLAEFLRINPTELIKNIGSVRKAIAVIGRAVVPLVINDGNANQCYLASPYVHYIAYMKYEVKKMKPLWASWLVRVCLTALGLLARSLQFSRAVSVNNWLFTTSMLNNLNDEEVRGLKHLLQAHFPDHAWVYREFKDSDTDLAAALSSNGFRPLIHRPVFEWNPQEYLENKFRHKIRQRIKSDISLTAGHPYSVRRAKTGESTELAARFYEDLYIRKHSRFNAHFTSLFFDVVLSTEINRLSFFETDNRTVAFMTTCPDSDRLIASLVGYDQSISKPHPSPYRAATGEAFRQSLEAGRVLFLSTGVATFKKNRGAYESIEYEAFEVAHLGLLRRLPWYAIKAFLDAMIRIMNTGDI